MTNDLRFVPDSQIIYPSVFLSNNDKIGFRACQYRDCFNHLQQHYSYIILPSNKSDFSTLILKKFCKFLEIIENEVSKARQNKITEADFYRKTYGLLSSMDAFGKSLGDLLLFWEANKEVFWSFVSLDYTLTRTRMTNMTLEKMGEFSKLCRGHEEFFSEEEAKLSQALYLVIKEARDKKLVTHFANDGDLLILADCFIYKQMRFLEGFMYLVTGDDGLHGITEEIIKSPKTIFPDAFKETERYVGFEPLKPDKFLNRFKKAQNLI